MRYITLLIISLIVIVSMPAGARTIPARPFFLDTGITMNGAEIPPGMYSLTLESQGASVRATLWREGRFVATAQGTWVKHGVKYTEDAVLLRVNSDGTRSLTEIRLAGIAKTIVLDGENSVLRVAPELTKTDGASRLRTGNRN